MWRCEARGLDGGDGTTTVAVKTLKENASEKEKKDIVTEMEIMKMLEPHPNVVTLLATCADKEPVFLIMEFVPLGKLQSYLRDHRAGDCCLTSRDLTSFAYQVAKGMEYISSKGVSLRPRRVEFSAGRPLLSNRPAPVHLDHPPRPGRAQYPDRREQDV